MLHFIFNCWCNSNNTEADRDLLQHFKKQSTKDMKDFIDDADYVKS